MYLFNARKRRIADNVQVVLDRPIKKVFFFIFRVLHSKIHSVAGMLPQWNVVSNKMLSHWNAASVE